MPAPDNQLKPIRGLPKANEAQKSKDLARPNRLLKY